MTARSIRSALAQRPRPPAEIIVVDDCSTDDTGSVAADLGARVIWHERNQGEGAARNTAIAHATQPWIGLLDSDDEWLPSLLETLWPLRGDHVAVAGAALYRGPGPGDLRYDGPAGPRPRVLRSPDDLIYPANPLPNSGVIVRTDAVRAAGGYDTTLRFGADLDLWLRLLREGSAIVSPEVVVDYHVHPEQVTQDKAAMSAAQLGILRARTSGSRRARLAIEAWLGGSYWDHARRRQAAGDQAGAVRAVAPVLAHPARLAGLAGLLLHRRRMRARTADLAPRA